jgi:hypothetical protein
MPDSIAGRAAQWRCGHGGPAACQTFSRPVLAGIRKTSHRNSGGLKKGITRIFVGQGAFFHTKGPRFKGRQKFL